VRRNPDGRLKDRGPVQKVIGHLGQEGALGVSGDALDPIAAKQRCAMSHIPFKKARKGKHMHEKECHLRDLVELVYTVIDVLEIGINIRPSLAGRTEGRAVVGRRSLTDQYSKTSNRKWVRSGRMKHNKWLNNHSLISPFCLICKFLSISPGFR
jgi:hypothetical protein